MLYDILVDEKYTKPIGINIWKRSFSKVKIHDTNVIRYDFIFRNSKREQDENFQMETAVVYLYYSQKVVIIEIKNF